MPYNKNEVVKAAAFLLVSHRPSTSSGKKDANPVVIKISEAFVNNCCACALCLVRFLLPQPSQENGSWPVCSLIINTKGTGEKKETICL